MDCEIVVEGYRATGLADIDLREEAWAFAFDQRQFGPRRLVVAFGDRSGRLLGLSHTERSDPPERTLAPCIVHAGSQYRAAVAVAYCDEPVADAPPPPDLGDRFEHACSIARGLGVHLVDWFACDDTLVRSSRLALGRVDEWWDIPDVDEI